MVDKTQYNVFHTSQKRHYFDYIFIDNPKTQK